MIIENNSLSTLRTEHTGSTIALRFGCYDVLHYGHQKGVDFAASQADILAIGVMPDEYIERRKGRPPINPTEARIAAIDAAEGVGVSFVIPHMGNLAILRSLFALQPDVYVEGNEHGSRLLKARFLEAVGIRYVIDEKSKVASSSEIISRLGADEAARVSGLDFHP